LHDKSDIAAELAWRDQEIDRLRSLQREAAGDGEGVSGMVLDGSMSVDDAVKAVAEIYPSADKQALRTLARALTKQSAPRPTGTEVSGDPCHHCGADPGQPCYPNCVATSASADPGCVIRLGVDDWNPYELLDIARLHVPANDLLLDRIKECLRQQRTVQSSTDARGGGEAVAWQLRTQDITGAWLGWETFTDENQMLRMKSWYSEHKPAVESRALYPHTTPAALDAEDAARWRFVRDNKDIDGLRITRWDKDIGESMYPSPALAETLVDAARATTGVKDDT
jgi:hypothetical protein